MAHEDVPTHEPHCGPSEHAERAPAKVPERAFRGAVALFKALSDERRLRTLAFLSEGEACGSEIAAVFDEPLSTVSHRMKLLETAGLVARRRAGRHVYFRLLDDHVLSLVRDALEHALE
ncbi:MAG: winged helix-turn-helix transcriptional regulator [Planctomycetes bacterium]|jgi:DNA-binding transcriptional ArsR family regulator|nr:winged helix-turn-helix transcriptional regulator [Planctomycetota bacterium]